MKKRLFGFVGLLILAGLNASPAVAQDQTLRSVAGDKWVITAKAGGVGYVEGPVTVTRKDGRGGRLIKGDNVEVGDRVSTGADGRAEILLNPGSYLRIAENSAFEFKTTALDDLKILVERGSVILEVYAGNDFQVSVTTPKEEYGLIQTGVYRIDVAADGNARLEVWKGKAEVDNEVVKGGKTASTLDGQVAVAKFDRDERDAFEQWSRDRSKELAKSTNDLKDRTLRTSLMRSFLGGRWNMYNSFGLWVYNPRFGRYCFLPFGYGWSSPYGFGFGSDIWWHRLPPVVFNPPTGGGNGGGTGGGTGTPPPGGIRGRTPTGDGPPIDRMGRRGGRPPYVEMQGGPSTGPGAGRFGGGGAKDDGGFTPGPTFDPGPRNPGPVVTPRVDAPSPPASGGIRSVRGKEQPN